MVFEYAVNISENHMENGLHSLREIVSEERKIRADRYLFNKDALRCVTGEVLLRYGLWKHYRLTNNEIKFCYNKYGKPYLEGREDIYFNISHSGDWVICGLGDIPIGVDVEKIAKQGLSLAECFFTSEEYYDILYEPTQKQADFFFKLWTLKESYIKAVGKGLHISLNSFRFQFFNDEIQFFIGNKRNHTYQFVSDKLDEKHYRALCVKNNIKGEIFNNITILMIHELEEYVESCRY